MKPTDRHGPLLVTRILALLALLALSSFAHAQVDVEAASDHAPLLASADPTLAANKRLVYDFWREVFEGGHLELADKYLAEAYIQHNPNVPTGRAGFVAFFAKFSKPAPIADAVKAPLVAIVAERDLVILSFAQEHADPADPTRKYTTTWFDMFRVADGKIVEHWDAATRQQ
jgi:predicted SnoaL-like aldol condensation-catalyzing enzyme